MIEAHEIAEEYFAAFLLVRLDDNRIVCDRFYHVPHLLAIDAMLQHVPPSAWSPWISQAATAFPAAMARTMAGSPAMLVGIDLDGRFVVHLQVYQPWETLALMMGLYENVAAMRAEHVTRRIDPDDCNA